MKNLSLCILEQQYSTILKDGEDKCWKCLLHAANIFLSPATYGVLSESWCQMGQAHMLRNVNRCESMNASQWHNGRERKNTMLMTTYFFLCKFRLSLHMSTSQPQATFHDVHSETFKLIWRFYLKKEPQWSQELIATKPLLKAQSVINCRKDPTEAVKKPPTLLREAKQQIWKLKASY